MLLYDIIFNFVMVPFDLAMILILPRLWRKRGFDFLSIVATIVFIYTPVFLARDAALVFGVREFGAMRFFGMAAFWHLPIILAVFACTFRHKVVVAGSFLFLAALSFSLYIYAYHIEPTWLQVTHYTFTSPKLKGLERPITIAQVADFQTDHFGAYERRALQRLAELKPDIIVYNGDYVHTFTEEEYARLAGEFHDLLKEIHLAPPLGSYAVIGDVDDEQLWPNVFAGQNVKLMNDETVVLLLPGCRVNLTGLHVKTSRAKSREELDQAFQGRDESLLDLIIAHSPDFVDVLNAKDEGFLALAGHTHGGQVRLPFLGPIMTMSRLPRKYADGFLPYGSGTLSVSRGVGMERCDAPRLRFLCRPEIRLIALKPPE